MALKLFPIQFPIFGPNTNPSPSPRPATELRFARWNNANAEKFSQRQREQQEIEDDIRRTRRFESATNIIDSYETPTSTSTKTNAVTFKSTGTPSSPSRPSIPGRKSKYSKPETRVSHPAFRRISKLPSPTPTDGEKTVVDRRAEVRVSEDGVSYVIDGAPFEFKYSYTETPTVKPLKLREPPFSPFGPTTMARPWTGRAPLPPSKKKPREFDSFVLPPPNKKGVKTVQAPGPFRPGSGPRYVQSREEMLGEPLTKEEIKELINSCSKSSRQLNMGRDGFTHNMLDNIHAHWKRRRVCKIKCKGVCTVDMDNVCQQLEERTGGKIIFRKGGVLYLFRGRNYNYKTRPKFPLMLWKPVTPLYPRLIQRVPDGLTLEEATNMRKKGRDLIPICKLAKNGVYCNLVRHVREAFEACELVRINCQGLNPTDYRKIGAKLRDLVPCVLISFEREHILMWRGRDWKSSIFIPENNDENGSDQSSIAQLSDDEDERTEPLSDNDESLNDMDIDTILESSEVEVDNLSTVKMEQPYALESSTLTSSEAFRSAVVLDNPVRVDPAVNESEDVGNRFSAEPTSEDPDCMNEMPTGTMVESESSLGSIGRTKELQDDTEGENHCSEQVKLNSSSVEVLLRLLNQAVDRGNAVIIADEDLDDDHVYQRAVAFAKSAPPGPVFKRRSREVTSDTKRENAEVKYSETKEVPSTTPTTTTQRDRKERKSIKLGRELESHKRYLDAVPNGKLGIDELAELLA